MKMLNALNTEDRLVIGSMIVTMAGIILGAVLHEPRSFGITTLIVIVMLLVGWGVTRSKRLAWLLPFGLVTGIAELWADWIHAEHFHSIIYTDFFGFKVLASPSYMPVGWWVTTIQFGYLALRLSERWPERRTVGLIALLGMSLPPWYEELAAPARAWHYTSTGPMLSHTPVWIVLTYGGCMFGIAFMALRFYRERAWGSAVLAGLFAGAMIMFSGVFWFSLVGR